LTFDYTSKLLGVVIPHKEQAYIVLQIKVLKSQSPGDYVQLQFSVYKHCKAVIGLH